MSDYIDPQVIEGFRVEVTSQLAEAVEFAINRRVNDGEVDDEECRQAAQDALYELTLPLVDAFRDAYKKSPLGVVDDAAIALLFQRHAIKAKLFELVDEPWILEIETRKESHTGRMRSIVEYEGEEAVVLETNSGSVTVPIVAIIDLRVVEDA